MFDTMFSMYSVTDHLLAQNREPGAIVGPIADLMGTIYNGLFNFIYSFSETGSLILAIIVFTLLVKILLLPLSYKQVKGTYRMQKLQPELNKIKAKYADKNDEESKRKMSFEMQEFQRENGASMMAGCLPMLIQLPILYALFYIFRQPYNYVEVLSTIYNSITQAVIDIPAVTRVEMLKPVILAKEITVDVSIFEQVLDLVRQMTSADWSIALSSVGETFSGLNGLLAQKNAIEYFFGFNLLTNAGLSFPGILIPIFAGVTTFLSSYLMQKRQQATNPAGTDDMSANMAKSMNIFMPIMMGVITISAPIALGIYWSLSNLFSIFQTWGLNKIVESKDKKGELKFKEKKQKEDKTQKATIVDKNKYTNHKGADK